MLFEKTGGVLGYGIEFVPILGDSVMGPWVLVGEIGASSWQSQFRSSRPSSNSVSRDILGVHSH